VSKVNGIMLIVFFQHINFVVVGVVPESVNTWLKI